MGDYIVRATAADNAVRILAVSTKEMVEALRTTHGTTNTATAALGRLATAGALMGAMQKNAADVMTLQVACAGPVGGITVTSSYNSDMTGVRVKGYVKNPDVDIPLKENGKLDVSGALGAGFLSVIKDLGLKEPFVGQTELVSGEIAEDLTYYFANSEQTPSSVALGVFVGPDGKVSQAGGFIVQLLPFADDELIGRLEEKLTGAESITTMLRRLETPEAILHELFDEFGLILTDRLETGFVCDCSRERVEKALYSIEAKEIEEMIADGEPVELKCHFCNRAYLFSTDDLRNILQNKINNK